MDGTTPIGPLRSTVTADASPTVGRVLDLGPDGPVLAIGVRQVVARRATSCLVEPAPGDTVLALDTGTEIFVLAILQRSSDSPAVLSVPEAASATLAQESLSIRCETLTVDAGTATLRSRVARAAGQALQAVAERLDVVARSLRRSADHEFSHAKTATRTVEGMETVTAGELMLEARTALAQRAGIVLVDAREDVRINGERITMG